MRKTPEELDALRAQMEQLASDGYSAPQALAVMGLPRASFYRIGKGIDWPEHPRSEETRKLHADNCRQTLIDSGRLKTIDIGNGPQTLRQIAREKGIPYSTLKYRYTNNKPLF